PSDITNRYLAQDWPFQLSKAADDPPPPMPPNYQGPPGSWNPPPAPWIKRSFTLRVSELPESLATYFEGVPGVIIDSLTLSASGDVMSGTWQVEGIIYENRI